LELKPQIRTSLGKYIDTTLKNSGKTIAAMEIRAVAIEEGLRELRKLKIKEKSNE
jgi:hypothetical protein